MRHAMANAIRLAACRRVQVSRQIVAAAQEMYDTGGLSVGAYAEHLVCLNGMTSEMYFARFTFKHHQGNISRDEQTEKACAAIMPASQAKQQLQSSRKRRERQSGDILVTAYSIGSELACTIAWASCDDRTKPRSPHRSHDVTNGVAIVTPAVANRCAAT
jgi:hypothetical protein